MPDVELREITPDIDSPCKRYGLVRIGDGLYRIPVMSLGAQGRELRKAMEAIKATGEGEPDLDEKFETVYRLAMSRFYNPATVDALMDAGFVGYEEVGDIIAVVNGTRAEDTEKKSSADVS